MPQRERVKISVKLKRRSWKWPLRSLK